MGRVLLCVGEYAKIPYNFPKLNIRVFCIEELCYVLKGNALLLDEEVVNRRLVKWIDAECKLSELANTLYSMVNQRCSVSAFVTTIFEYTGYYDSKVISKVEHTLKEGANLSGFEKKKAQIDYELRQGKNSIAAREYDALLDTLDEQESQLQAKLLHNKGVALARTYAYGFAADNFLQAYEISGNEESYMQYLAAKRMELGDNGYIQFVADKPEVYEKSLELEKRIKAAISKWDDNESNKKYEQLLEWKKRNTTLYYEEVDKIVRGMKEDYRLGVEE